MPYLVLYTPTNSSPISRKLRRVHARTPFFLGEDLGTIPPIKGSNRHWLTVVDDAYGLLIGEEVLAELGPEFAIGSLITVGLRTSRLSEIDATDFPGGTLYQVQLEIRPIEGRPSFIGIGMESLKPHFFKAEIAIAGSKLPSDSIVLQAENDSCDEDDGVPVHNSNGPDFEGDIEPYL